MSAYSLFPLDGRSPWRWAWQWSLQQSSHGSPLSDSEAWWGSICGWANSLWSHTDTHGQCCVLWSVTGSGVYQRRSKKHGGTPGKLNWMLSWSENRRGVTGFFIPRLSLGPNLDNSGPMAYSVDGSFV